MRGSHELASQALPAEFWWMDCYAERQGPPGPCETQDLVLMVYWINEKRPCSRWRTRC